MSAVVKFIVDFIVTKSDFCILTFAVIFVDLQKFYGLKYTHLCFSYTKFFKDAIFCVKSSFIAHTPNLVRRVMI